MVALHRLVFFLIFAIFASLSLSAGDGQAAPNLPPASGAGRLVLTSSGLPSGEPATVVLHGAGIRREVKVGRKQIVKLPAGRYSLDVRRVVTTRAHRGVRQGAVAYPERMRIRVAVEAGASHALDIGYRAVVNPGVELLPAGALQVIGNPEDPTAIVFSMRTGPAAVGTIYTAAPGPQLPHGLISKVTSVKRVGSRARVSLEAVPVTEAVPSLEFDGSLALEPLAGASAADSLHLAGGSDRASASKSCSAPKLIKIGAHLDNFELRQASIGTWPPQMRLTLAVRTTESFGATAVAAGINCDWALAELGPYQAAIPVGPVVIPVYATLPVNAGAHIDGRFGAATVNVASTTVATAAAGFDENKASLTQQGSNVWTSGSLSLSGSAKLSASVGVQAGIGVVKGANVHLSAGFGPEFDWTAGQACDLYLNLGSLSAGVTVLGKSLNTPSFTPLKPKLWSGCEGGGSGGGGGSIGGGAQSDAITLTNPGDQSGTVGVPVHLQVEATDAMGVPLTYGASGLPLGLTIDSSTGLITGTPEAAGNRAVALTVENGRGQSATQTLGWVVSPAAGQVGWTVEPIQVPTGATQVALRAVSCAEATACMGVGYSEGGPGGSGPLAETWDGSSWTLSSATSPGPDYGFLGVSCPSATWCAAVGSGNGEAVAETWNGTRWTKEAIVAPPGSQAYMLSGVSCTSPSHCIAVGDYNDDEFGAEQVLAEDWDGSTWTEGSAVDPSPGAVRGDSNSDLWAISCATVSSCIAVGDYEDRNDDTDPALAESWDGVTWTVDPTPQIPRAFQTDLNSVSCWASESCMAVGSYVIFGNPPQEGNAVSERWDGAAWHLQDAPVLPNTFSGLDSLSCRSATFCAGLGDGTYIAHWDGTWSYGAFGTVLDAVSCISETYCVAVGSQSALYATS